MCIRDSYDSDLFFGDYHDEILYRNSPIQYLHGMSYDHPFVEMYRQCKIVLCCGCLLYTSKLFKVYLSLIKPSFLSGMKSALSLGVKVAVMAEILAGLPYGVGRVINYARSSQFDMTEVFAWTLWLVIMIMIIEYGLKKLIRDE